MIVNFLTKESLKLNNMNKVSLVIAGPSVYGPCGRLEQLDIDEEGVVCIFVVC